MTNALQTGDTIIVGGGFFGARLALELASGGAQVLLLEKGAALLTRASAHNQARVHNGYHYPRSVLTALRSRVNFSVFMKEYADCVDDSFVKVYAIGRIHSKLNAAQFRTFCKRIDADLHSAPPHIANLFHPDLIEEAFIARECAVDASKLRARLSSELAAAGVRVILNADAEHVSRDATGRGLRVEYTHEGNRESATAAQVFHCCYARMNALLAKSALPLIPLKHELTEIVLVEQPEVLRGLGITVMDGPFFSTMPYPSRALHSLTHVRYTPHCAWFDGQGPYVDPYEQLERAEKRSRFPEMIRDSARYLPALASCVRKDSLWEVKTLLPASEQDDSRPILYRRDHGLPGLTCILGGKLDNIYDLLQELRLAAIAA